MLNYYTTQIIGLVSQNEVLQKSYNTISNIRLALIVFGLATFIFGFQISIYLGFTLLILFILGFYYLVKYHENTENSLSQNKNKQRLLNFEVDKLNARGVTEEVYENGSEYADSHHIYAADLDLFGDNSLFLFLNRAKTKLGKETIAHNLLTIETSQENLNKKQHAVKELRDKSTWRLDFLASLINLSPSDANTSHEIAAIPRPPVLAFGGFIKWYGEFLPLIWVIFFTCFYLNKFEGIGFGLSIFILFNFFLNGLNKKKTEPYLEQISVTGRAIQSFSKAANLIANENFESQILKEILRDFPKSDLNSKNPIEGFSMILKRLEMRKNMMASLFLIIAKPFEPIETLKLGEWLQANPTFFKQIFKTIGELEYYASLGTASFNNPQWSFPEFHPRENEFIKADSIGHPLLKNHTTVCNDFELNSQNSVNLITGSNMSGKSTFLRTMGINLILANTGGPVFAKKFQSKLGLTPLCYMRITDSISENASTFKAEIERIKLVLTALGSNTKHLFLIDEMLRGTNSEDKLKGSVALFEKLVNEGAVALLATHDLRLSEVSDKHPDKVKNFYFEYSTEKGELIFDYLIKEGLCKSFNASILLESIGLKID